MKRLAIGVAVATLMAAALPAWSETSTPQSNANQPGNVTGPAEKPGAGGVSKPSMPGAPGSKSGRTMAPSGSSGEPEGKYHDEASGREQCPGKARQQVRRHGDAARGRQFRLELESAKRRFAVAEQSIARIAVRAPATLAGARARRRARSDARTWRKVPGPGGAPAPRAFDSSTALSAAAKLRFPSPMAPHPPAEYS
jgi:hypothetical protein